MKKIFFLFAALLLSVRLSAQLPAACPGNVPFFASDCATACIACQSTGWLGSNAGESPSSGLTVCGSIVLHNDVWLAFIAGTPLIDISVQSSNCELGDGLQIAFFESCDATDALTCNPGDSGFGGMEMVLTYAEFVPGQVYYLVLDGFNGDVCDFTIQVNEGQIGSSNTTTPVTGPLTGPTEVCSGDTATYAVPAAPGPGYYVWNAPEGTLINGQPSPVLLPLPDAANVTVVWGNEGGPICVQGDACNDGDPLCLTVSVSPGLYELPPVTACADQPYVLPWGDSVTTSGTYERTYPRPGACDSIVRLTVFFPSPIVVDLGVIYLCTNECYMTCDSLPICVASVYSYTCQTAQGCDSTTIFTLAFLPVPTGQIQTPQGRGLTCLTTSLTLDGGVTNPTDPVWTNAQGQVAGQALVITVTQPGMYTFTSGAPGCRVSSRVLIKQNTQPPDLSASGGTLDAAHPTVQLQGNSTTFPVQYSWTGPNNFSSNQAAPLVAVPGEYTLTVLNPGTGCTNSVTVTVTQE